jgi:hypothetical protein
MTINIHGKPYVEVKDRVAEFRKDRPEWSILTKIEHNNEDNGTIIIKASIVDDEGRTRATGHAHEWRGDKSSMVNATSWVENAETSAIGRALASLGYGIEESFASANEVQRAEAKGQIASKQTDSDDWRDAIVPIGKNKGKTLGELAPKQRQWYLENYEANEKYPDSVKFRELCDSCLNEIGPGDIPRDLEIPDEISEQNGDLDEEDVPF